MKSSLIISICLGLIWGKLIAQGDVPSAQAFRGSLQGSQLLPSTLNLKSHKWQIDGGLSLWASSTFFSNQVLFDLFKKNQEVYSPDINTAIDKLKYRNIAGTGTQVLQGIAFQVPIYGKNISFSFGVNHKFGVNFGFSKNMLSLFWNGNKQWAGQKVELTPFAVNGSFYREFAFGVAGDVFKYKDLSIRAGGKFKLLQGLAAVYMPQARIDLTTAATGEYLRFDYNYNISYAANENRNPFVSPSGSGAAVDLGLTFTYKNRINLDWGITDLGKINYKNNAENIQNNKSFLYEGFDFTKLDGVSSTVYLDSLYTALGFDTPKPGSFKMPLGTRMTFQGSYSLSGEDDLKDKGKVFLTYIQGFKELPFSTRKAALTMGYQKHFFKWLEFGFTAGMGGFTKYNFGMMAGIRSRDRFHLAISSVNLLGLMIPGIGHGVDFNAHLIWSFGTYKH